ncbi:hypothetical protein BDN70DRAFT_721812 [Pholiota conissans]|uniref:Uncharacterized protein n=1 Tax=Pholiota conissans TaxID=109636 RepID=A0A9P5YJL1_9AGAR|nr:hypothetical protein BDN70DRAFT_721812 [Pholiota conissans]
MFSCFVKVSILRPCVRGFHTRTLQCSEGLLAVAVGVGFFSSHFAPPPSIHPSIHLSIYPRSVRPSVRVSLRFVHRLREFSHPRTKEYRARMSSGDNL